ncbi:PREDICTED: uncharacterized protein LOC106748846 [Dinoponera quadriceps]|uniref:Uncharacterized protein LOC106748846 n=1 Tax=Dinoponera quadriceps TaxID=609295 RepID=A0A6P3XXD5_DINQU|nr:PREDICTED: uncharacterized protein LOC106748846 [Dinoponera quadriceps]
MINLPCNVASMSQVTPCQNVPVQTSQYNFPTCQQRQTNTQQMQTAACGPCFGVSQGPSSRVYRPDTYIVTHQCTPGGQPITNPCQPVFQSPCNPSSPPSYPSCTQLPLNILDQIRACVNNATPVFILPGNCQQSPPAPQQQPQPPPQPPSTFTPSQSMTSPPTTAYPPGGLTYPAACYPPPPFYPYPIPFPFCDQFTRAREATPNCGCCRRRDVDSLSEARRVGTCSYDADQDEHHCTPTTDDTICSRRNCPSSLHLQALASQFLSMQGIIACAATRLVLRKIPGSNVTTTMEDTMARAQKTINTLTKDQLLSESRNAQQVNALINLHMTANPPANVIPILTLVQLKMNLLKAQVEGLVNRRLMETQGVGMEVEAEPIDPTVLALRSDAELRDLLSALRQKECDEQVNVNFAPYRSQRVIAESRLCNVQSKLRQVEAEFERRRCAMLPAPTLSARIVQQFSDLRDAGRLAESKRLYSSLPPDPSPDPFIAKPRSPKRLLLKPCSTSNLATTTASQTTLTKTQDTRVEKSTGDGGGSATERSTATEISDKTGSEENVDGAKKKLRARIAVGKMDETTVGREKVEGEMREDVSSARLTSGSRVNVVIARKEQRGTVSHEGTPYREGDVKRWATKAYINVGYEPARTLVESGSSDTITLNVRKSSDAIAGRVTDREGSGRSADLRRSEKQAAVEMTISGEEMEEAIEEENVAAESTRSFSPVAQEEAKGAAEVVVDEDRILSAPETERASPSDVTYTSSLHITLKRRKKGGEDEKTEEGSKDESGRRFHIVSFLTDIVHDRNRECQRKRKIDEKTATKRDHAKNALPEGSDLPKLCVLDRQRQIAADALKEDNETPIALRANAFPPLKRESMADSKKSGNDVGACPNPITNAGMAATECLFRCNDVRKDSSGTFYKDDVEYDSSFISEIFSLIGNRLVTFINKIIALNGRLLSSDAILRDKEYRGRIRKIKRSLIDDREADTRCLLINRSNCSPPRDFGQLYEIRRSLLIRSRLKKSVNSQNHPHPFFLLKHARNGVLESYRATQNENTGAIEGETCKLRGSEKFWALSEVTETSDRNNTSGKQETEECGNEFIMMNLKQFNDCKKQTSNKHLHNDIKNNVFTKQRCTNSERSDLFVAIAV